MIAMLVTGLAALALTAGGVRVLPIEPDTRVFLADATGNAVADICLLTGHALSIHDGADPTAEPVTLDLPEGTSAFDIIDIDGDGAPELVYIQGDAIVRQALRAGRQPTVLFERPNRLAHTAAEPYPYVLVVEKDDGAFLALPGADTFDLLTATGTVVHSVPIGEDARQRVEFGQPFRTWTTAHPQLGPPGSLEGYASHIVAFEPDLPADLVPIAREGQLYQTPRMPRPDTGDGQSWSAFRIGMREGHEVRARAALAPGEQAETRIRIETLPLDEAGRPERAGSRLGPERKYPGTLLLSEPQPDFDGDGHADLLLWQAPLPGRSLGALTEAVTAATWPVRLRIHTFDPDTGRFAARAHASVSVGIPVEWFLIPDTGGPVRLHVTADFDYDGKTDMGCATGPREFTLWYAAADFRAAAARVLSTTDPLESIAFVEPLGDRRAATLALRTARTLHVVDP